MVSIYPSFTLLFLVFNLLGWWFKGVPFFNWWWLVLIMGLQIITEVLILALTKLIIRHGVE